MERWSGHDGLHLGLLRHCATRELVQEALRLAEQAHMELLGRRAVYSVERADCVSREALGACFRNDGPNATTWITIDGDLEGIVGVTMCWHDAQTIWRAMLGYAPGSPDSVSDAEAGALMEFADGVVGGFLQSASKLTGLSLLAAPPTSVIAEDGLAFGFMGQEGEWDDSAFAVRIRVGEGEDEASFALVYLPAVGGAHAVLEALGISEAA